MGLFEKLFNKKQPVVTGYFKTLTAYTPVFTTRDGGLYEMEMTRSAIHAFATHASKLKPEVLGDARPKLERILQYQPNPWMDTTKFLYRIATIVEAATTSFIVPLYDPTDRVFWGLYPILPTRCEIVSVEGEPWLRYDFGNGQKAAIEFSRVGIITKHQFRDDFFGSGNDALSPTLDLLDLNRQGMTDSIEQSAILRFMGRLTSTLRPEDIKAERDRFSADNLSADNKSGLLLVDGKYADIKQIQSKPFLIDAEQMKLIQTNVFNYFGANESILQNSYDEDGWNAYYEGKVEPFALQLGLVLTNMLYTETERAAGNEVMFSSNRLQYASNATKLQVVQSLVDRGLMTDHDACDIFNIPKPETEPRRVIRGEYIDVSNLPMHTVDQAKSYMQPAKVEE